MGLLSVWPWQVCYRGDQLSNPQVEVPLSRLTPDRYDVTDYPSSTTFGLSSRSSVTPSLLCKSALKGVSTEGRSFIPCINIKYFLTMKGRRLNRIMLSLVGSNVHCSRLCVSSPVSSASKMACSWCLLLERPRTYSTSTNRLLWVSVRTAHCLHTVAAQ